MAQVLVLLTLLKKLMREELRSMSSLGLNNMLFCIFLLMSGSHLRQNAFYSTVFFQLVLLVPLLVTFSVDTQDRLPRQRVASWPLTNAQRRWFSTLSFFLNPLLAVLLLGYLIWMGLAIGLFFLLLGLFVHLLVYSANRFLAGVKTPMNQTVLRVPFKAGGIALETWRELSATLDFWTALLVAIVGTLYRVFGHSPDVEAFPVMSMVVAIAMSTAAQRMLSFDEGRALLRYRLLPMAGWKVLMTQDVVLLVIVAVLVAPLNLRAGCTCTLITLAIGRYPSIKRRVDQRRWRFVGGDFRFGVAQVVFGGLAGLGAVRVGLWAMLIAVVVYGGSLLWGGLLWNRNVVA